MEGFLAVIAMAWRTFVRDRGALFWGIAFPVMLMGLIGSVFGSGGDLTLNTAVVVPDDNALAAGIVEALQEVPVLNVSVEEEAAALERLRRGDRSLVVVLPGEEALSALALPRPGLAGASSDTQPAIVHVYFDEGRAQVTQAGIAIVREVVSEVNRGLTQRPEPLAVTQSGLSAEPMSMFDFLLPGILAMTIMNTGLMGVTWVISDYRERRVLKRVLTTPFSPVAFLSGMIGRFTITNIAQGLIIVLIGVFVFKANVVGSYLNLIVLVVIGSITFLCIGFAISTLSKTAEAASNLGSAVSFPMMFLSGTFWPREMIPAALQPVINLLPLTPLVDAMRSVTTQASSLAAHAGGILYLLCWAVVAVALATWRFRWE